MCPTIKQKRAMDSLSESVRKKKKITMGEVMLKGGYSEQSSKKPKRLTKSKGWQELMEKYLPDKELAKFHNLLLNKKEAFIKWDSKKKKWGVVRTEEIDAQAVGKGLDLAYKIKSKYTPLEIKVLDQYENETDEQLDERIAFLEKRVGESSRIKRKKGGKISKEKTKSA